MRQKEKPKLEPICQLDLERTNLCIITFFRRRKKFSGSCVPYENVRILKYYLNYN